MTTAEKREYIDRNYPALVDFVMTNAGYDTRKIDNEMQGQTDVTVLQYTITLLCDEIIRLVIESEQ